MIWAQIPSTEIFFVCFVFVGFFSVHSWIWAEQNTPQASGDDLWEESSNQFTCIRVWKEEARSGWL